MNPTILEDPLVSRRHLHGFLFLRAPLLGLPSLGKIWTPETMAAMAFFPWIFFGEPIDPLRKSAKPTHGHPDRWKSPEVRWKIQPWWDIPDPCWFIAFSELLVIRMYCHFPFKIHHLPPYRWTPHACPQIWSSPTFAAFKQASTGSTHFSSAENNKSMIVNVQSVAPS